MKCNVVGCDRPPRTIVEISIWTEDMAFEDGKVRGTLCFACLNRIVDTGEIVDCVPCEWVKYKAITGTSEGE